MRFYTVTPNYFVIRNENERKSLQKILLKLGLTLTPVQKDVLQQYLQETESGSDDSTETYSDSEEDN